MCHGGGRVHFKNTQKDLSREHCVSRLLRYPKDNTAALEAVINELNAAGADRLGLNVFDSNTAAIALYSRVAAPHDQ